MGRPKGRNFKARNVMLSDDQVAYLLEIVAATARCDKPMRGISEALRAIVDAHRAAGIERAGGVRTLGDDPETRNMFPGGAL